jgi:hypothetical protein
MINRKVLAAFSAIMLACMTGCGGGGSERAALRGAVTFDGAPVESGVLALIPTAGTEAPSSGCEIKAGKYDIPQDRGPIPGKYRVEITAMRSSGTLEVKGVNGSTGGASGGGAVPKVEMFIPDRYNTKSALTIEITPGRNQQNFELKSKE